MKYLPFENYELVTGLSVEEVHRRLSAQVGPATSFWLRYRARNDTKPYEGNINHDRFSIKRVIYYRNSFLPVITGHILAAGGKTVIKIKMRLAPVVLVFMCVWMGIVGLVCILMLAGAVTTFSKWSGKNFSPMVFIPFIMFLFGWCLSFFGFKNESRKAREFLATLFQGEEIPAGTSIDQSAGSRE